MQPRKDHKVIDGVEVKHCGKCDTWKPLDSYNRNNKKWDGLSHKCKACEKQYREDNKENRSKYDKQRYHENRDSLLESRKKHYQNNRESILEQKKEYHQNNQERLLGYQKQYRKDNPEKCRKWARKRRAMKEQVSENYTYEQERVVELTFQHKCFRCGSTENLNHDHHRPLSKGYALTPSNAVLLCKSCNCAKSDKDPEEFYTKEELNRLSVIHSCLKTY